MTYKGYSARIEYDDDDRVPMGKIARIRDGMGFHTDSVESLSQAFREAVKTRLRRARGSERSRRNLLWTDDVPCHPGAALEPAFLRPRDRTSRQRLSSRRPRNASWVPSFVTSFTSVPLLTLL